MQQVKAKMKNIRSLDHNSMLRDNHEAMKRFSWLTVWPELNQ